MKKTNQCETPWPGRLSLGLAMTALTLLLNACSSHGPEWALTGGEQPAILRHGANQETRDRFWAGVKPMSTLAQAQYKLGRYYQKRGKHAAAIEQFSRALETDQSFVLAYNGLGVSYDALGDCEAAKQAYAKALRLGPNLAYLHNNLGCSRLICNDPEQAIAHLAKAAALDAALPRIQNNLKLAELRFQQQSQGKQETLGLTAPVPPAKGDADSGAQSSPGNPVVAAAPSTDRQPPASPQPAETLADEASAITIQPVVRVDQHMDPAQDATQPVPRNMSGCMIEIANGNGVVGMANRGAGFLRNHGFTVRRIINAPHFNYSKSTILFQEGFQDVAQAMADILPGQQTVELQPPSPHAVSAIRLIVGKDMAAIRFPQQVAQENDGKNMKTAPKIARLD